jgi:tetratricopeptide (TPR) repeat protein
MLKTLLLSFVLLFFISGCSHTISIRALEPAEVDRVATTKKISIPPFKNDKVGLSSKIEAILANYKLQGKNYFTIVSRNDFNKIIKEQKIQSSGLLNEDSAVEVGHLLGAEAIISGDVHSPSSHDTYFYESRTKCLDRKCKQLYHYNVRCSKRVVGLSAEVRVVDVLLGDIIYAQTLNKSETYEHCRDDSRVIPSQEIATQRLAFSLANRFTYKLLPHYKNFEVELLDDPDLDYSSEQEELLEIALEYIEQKRYNKAQEFLLKLIDSTKEQSYVAFYNLGVLKEAEGKYKEAQEYYTKADSLMKEPVEAINKAYLRINSLIEKRQRLSRQINTKS